MHHDGLRLAALVLLAVSGCSSGPVCEGAVEPRQSLVRLDPATGEVRTVAPVPVGEVARAGRELTVSPYGGRPTPLTQVDAEPSLAEPVRSDRTTLVGPGWQVPYAGGRYVGSVADRVVVLGVDEQLRGVRARDGRLEWNARLDHHLVSAHAVLAGGLVLATGNWWEPGESGLGPGVLYAVDGATGRLRWTQPLGPLQGQALVLDGARVLVGLSPSGPGSAGEVQAFDVVTGTPRWSTALPYEGVSWLGQAEDELVVVSARFVPGCA